MKAIILGSGNSLAQFNAYDWRGAMVFGANDVCAKVQVDFVVCADTYEDIELKRPKALVSGLPLYARSESGTWQRHEKRLNATLVTTRRWGGQFDQSPYQHFWHGFHTPFFAASIAMAKGAKELYFFGVDCDNFKEAGQRNVIREFDYLSRWVAVHLVGTSKLWEISERLGLELKAQKI